MGNFELLRECIQEILKENRQIYDIAYNVSAELLRLIDDIVNKNGKIANHEKRELIDIIDRLERVSKHMRNLHIPGSEFIGFITDSAVEFLGEFHFMKKHVLFGKNKQLIKLNDILLSVKRNLQKFLKTK